MFVHIIKRIFMKKLVVSVFLMTSVIVANAQLKDMMLKKVGEKVNKNKADKNASKDANANTNSNTNPQSNSSTTATDTTVNNSSAPSNTSPAYNPFMSGGKKEILPQYVFQQNVLMETKSWDKKGNLEQKKSSQMRWYFSNQPYNGMEMFDEDKKSAGFSVFESKKSQMVMLMDNDGNKIAMVTKIDTAKVNERAANSNEKSGNKVAKTGRTKKVLGYNCEEWISTDDKGNKTEMWISNEVPLTMNGSFAMFNRGGPKQQSSPAYPSSYPAGFMMEMTSYQANGEKFSMTAIEVNLKAEKIITTAGYVVY